jgi:hypothetical protein
MNVLKSSGEHSESWLDCSTPARFEDYVYRATWLRLGRRASLWPPGAKRPQRKPRSTELSRSIRCVLERIRNEPCASSKSSNLTYDSSWIPNRKAIGRDISGHNAARADSTIASNANSGKNYSVCSNPYMIFDCNRRRFSLFEAMLVLINDAQVMTQQTMAPNFYLLVCGNRCAVVNESVIAYRNMRAHVRNDLDRDNVPHHANTVSEFHVSTCLEADATIKSYRQW